MRFLKRRSVVCARVGRVDDLAYKRTHRIPTMASAQLAAWRSAYHQSVGSKRIRGRADARIDPGPDLPREHAMGRFHIRLPSGDLKAGAAFVEIWRGLTFWRPASIVASLPGATPALELGLRLVSPFRPVVARLLRHVA